MSDIYTEQLLKKKSSGKDKAIKVLLVLLTIVAVGLILFTPLALLATIILGVVDYFVFRNLNVEYEYLYINGNLDIDKIMSKSKRKNVFGMVMNDLEIMAPLGSAELRPFQGLKTVDYSSGMEGAKRYEMIVIQHGTKKGIIFEPNQTIVDGMRMLAPRKVHC